MSNEIAVPDYLKDLIDEGSLPGAKSFVTSGDSLPRISLKGRKFRYKEGGEEVKTQNDTIEVVIVGITPESGTSKTWYEKGYVPGDTDPPSCSSLNGVNPDDWVDNKQATTCAGCPQSKWGSAKSMSGGKAKACKESKILYVIDADDEEKKVWILQVTISSLRNLTAYGRYLEGNNMPYAACITQIIMDDETDFPKVDFQYIGVLKKDNIGGFVDIAKERPWDTGEYQNLLKSDANGETVAAEAEPKPKAMPKPDKSVVPESDADSIIENWGGDES